MKAFWVLILSVFLLSHSVTAQSTSKKAENILDQVSNTYDDYNTIKASFNYILEIQQDDFKEKQSGVIHLKDNKFRLKLEQQEIICNGKYVWTYLQDVNEVQINNYKPEQMEINPTEMFTMYKKGFLYGYGGEKELDGEDYQVIELTPNKKEKSYFKVRLLIDKKTYHIKRTRIFEKNGNIYTYQISRFYPNVDIPDNFFEFNKKDHPDVTVVDLR